LKKDVDDPRLFPYQSSSSVCAGLTSHSYPAAAGTGD
jgi:hypothetical protein